MTTNEKYTEFLSFFLFPFYFVFAREGLLTIYCFYFLKEEIEEEDCDSIERVLWHQPKGMAEEAKKNNKSTEPVLLSHLFDVEPNWNEMEFLIKWKGQSHLHCQWKSFYDLQNVSLLTLRWFCVHSVQMLLVECIVL